MTPTEALHATQLFAHLDDDQLRRLADACEQIELRAGGRLIEEGTDGDAFFVIVRGELDVMKRSGSGEVPLARLGPGRIVGEMAVIEGRARNASVTAATDGSVLRVSSAALTELLERPASALAVLRTVMGRLRSTEAMLREREKLAGLGTLAAGLAHELNNPAAAAGRSARALAQAVAAAESHPRPTPAPTPPDHATRPASALERADRIDGITPLTGDQEAAAALVEAGWTPASLAAQPPEVIPWLAADASVHQLLAELELAVGRISEIVAAVKGYVYLDQAPMQRLDVREGLDQTLVILRHRLREGITVDRRFADELPRIEANGPELNQVWTNLVDNAIDAMDGRGVLTISVEPDGDGVRVAICDTGIGIGDDIRDRLFEPFATTKPPGKGTGLGLHISHTAVARHGGRIEVDSAPGRTCFEVFLPAQADR